VDDGFRGGAQPIVWQYNLAGKAVLKPNGQKRSARLDGAIGAVPLCAAQLASLRSGHVAAAHIPEASQCNGGESIDYDLPRGR